MLLAKKLNKGAGTPIPKDPQFNYVTMLLHGDGTNGAQNNTFLDSSTNNFTITRNGNTTQGSFSPYGSNWGNYFNGTNDYFTSTGVNLSTGDVTFEFWIYPLDETVTYRCVYDTRIPGGSATSGFGVFQYGKVIEVYQSSLVVSSAANSIAINAWNHVALVRNSGTCQLYVNGVASGSSNSNTTNLNSTDRRIANATTSPFYYFGYISNLREVTSALYTSTFTPSTTPLTAISGTSLLTCQSNRFIDNSTNAFALTIQGTPSVQRFNPFGTATAYSTSVIGGSGYFDGSGDYLTVPDDGAFNLTTSNYTMELWVYPTTLAENVPFAYGWSSTGGNRLIVFIQQTNGTYQIYYNDASNTFVTSNAVKLNAWNHLALVRNGSNFNFYINGVSGASASNSFSYLDSPFPIVIGGSWSGSTGNFFYSGYISDVRVCVGAAVYTSNFTPPTAPLTTANTPALLCNFTNGAIFDNAMMNDLETVGNAQISTSVKKYGTGSLYFDGTGDALRGQSNTPNLQFATGNFTVECWLYQTATNVYPSVLEIGSHATQPGGVLFIASDGSTITAYNGTAGFLGTATAPALNTWNHIAWVRNNGVFKIYVNGVGNAGFAFTGNLNTSTSVTVGAEVALNASYTYTGYMDELRVTKGYARYTANFTPPTAAFPNNN
jgi:hypothetical protein